MFVSSHAKTDSQVIVQALYKLSTSERIHRRPLANLLAKVRSADQREWKCSPLVAAELPRYLSRAHRVLSAQGSRIEGQKRQDLNDLATLFAKCCERVITIETVALKDKQDRQCRVDACRNRTVDLICDEYAEKNMPLEQELRKVQSVRKSYEIDYAEFQSEKEGLDKMFQDLLDQHDFSAADRALAQLHYHSPKTRLKDGKLQYSDQHIFSKREATKRFLAPEHDIVNDCAYAKVDKAGAGNGKFAAWIEFGKLACLYRDIEQAMKHSPLNVVREKEASLESRINIRKSLAQSEVEQLTAWYSKESLAAQESFNRANGFIALLRSAQARLREDGSGSARRSSAEGASLSSGTGSTPVASTAETDA